MLKSDKKYIILLFRTQKQEKTSELKSLPTSKGFIMTWTFQLWLSATVWHSKMAAAGIVHQNQLPNLEPATEADTHCDCCVRRQVQDF